MQVLFFKKSIKIAPTQTLFSYGSPDSPVLGTDPTLAQDESGVLTLNMGPHAVHRLNGDTADDDESFTIRHVGGTAGNEDLEVTAFGVSQVYSGISRIEADGGEGNDTIDVEAGVLADADLVGGPGDDHIIYAGSGSATIEGGTGDDVLEALGPGVAQISDDAGNNHFVSGPGITTFLSNGGNNIFEAGTEMTTLVVSGASAYALSDTRLSVGAFVDTLIGIRNVRLEGSDRDDDFVVSNWSGVTTLDGMNGFDSFTVNLGGEGSTTIHHSGPIGRDLLTVNASPAGDNLAISWTQITDGMEVVSYPSNLESLDVVGGSGNDTFRVLGSVEGTLTIDGNVGNDTLDVVAVSRFTRTVFEGGAGDDTVNIGTSIEAGPFAGATIRGGLVLDGGAGSNPLVIDIPGDLRNLLQVANFTDAATIRVRGNLTHTLVATAPTLRCWRSTVR